MNVRKRHSRAAILVGLSSGILFQLSGCFGNITTTSTINGRDFFLNGLRGLLLGPLDNLIVQTVDNLFAEEQ